MRRIHEIIAEIRSRYSDDDFFTDFEDNYRNSESVKKAYQAYGRVLNKLDDQSWQLLKEKALIHYKDHRKGQKKQGFFNQLNESFAYNFLTLNGCQNVRVIKEDGNSKPDLEYIYNKSRGFCEVKSLGISDDEIKKRELRLCRDLSAFYDLSDGFLKKYHQAIDTAWTQINQLGKEGLVYLIISFDDIALDHYIGYREQILKYSKQNNLNSIHIKIGTISRKRISITLPFSPTRFARG